MPAAAVRGSLEADLSGAFRDVPPPDPVSSDNLRAAVLELLDKRIESFEQLEILLLLRSGSDRSWTAQEVGKHVRQPGHAEEALSALRAAGLVQAVTTGSQPHYVYSPLAPQLDAAVGELARQYREQPIAVMRTLSTNSIRRMRTTAARAFAEAFGLRKKEDGESG